MNTLLRTVAVASAAAALLTAANGISAADDPLVGKSYKDASATVSGWGQTPVVATTVGGRESTDDCVVTTWHKGTRQMSGQQKSVVLINLDCAVAAKKAS